VAQRDRQWTDTALDAFTRAFARATSRRQVLRLIGSTIVAGLLAQLRVTSVWAQSLVVIPGCGEAGKTKVCVVGSGFGEPQPPCHYRFLFDGKTVAPDQPDGLFGPPRQSFIVPAGTAPGRHKVRVELRLDESDKLLQAAEAQFKVVSASKDPWSATVTGPRIKLQFNPTDVCDVTPCKKIVLIQAMSGMGTKPDGTTEPVDWKQWHHLNGADLEANKINNVTIDSTEGDQDPYYNGGSDPNDLGKPGKQNGSPTPSTTSDTVSYTEDIGFKAGFSKLTINFEVAAFCAQGANAGQFLGILKWRWEREKGNAEVITVVSKTRDNPSQGFLDALNKWGTNPNHPFSPPKSKVQGCP
jgi:hypothetical protein